MRVALNRRESKLCFLRRDIPHSNGFLWRERRQFLFVGREVQGRDHVVARKLGDYLRCRGFPYFDRWPPVHSTTPCGKEFAIVGKPRLPGIGDFPDAWHVVLKSH